MAIEHRLSELRGVTQLLLVINARGHDYAEKWAAVHKVPCLTHGQLQVGPLGAHWGAATAWASLFRTSYPDKMLAFGWPTPRIEMLAAEFATPIVVVESLYHGGKGKPRIPRVKELCGVKTPLGRHSCDKFKDHPGNRHSWRENGKRKYEWFDDIGLRRGASQKRAESKRAKRKGD